MYDGVLSSEGQSKSILGPTITLVSDSKLLTSRVKPAGYVRRGEGNMYMYMCKRTLYM